MSANKDHAHSEPDAHGTSDHPVATDIIPDTSPQDLVLKVVTVVAFFLISGSFVWWYCQPLSVSEGHGGGQIEQH
jgi:hypothetical protein